MRSRSTTHRYAGGSSGAPAGRKPDEERRQAVRDRLIRLTRLLDSAVEVPLLRTRVGLDALLGLVPGLGDAASAALGLYLVLEARKLGASRWLQAKMIGNLLLDGAVGAVPIAGDLFDVYFKAHVRNLKLLQRELGEPFIDVDAVRERDLIDVHAPGAPELRR